MARVSRKIKVAAPIETFMKVVTDYEAYPKFLTSVKSADQVSKSENEAVVEFTAQAIKPFRYTLRLIQASPRELVWTLVKGEYMRKNEGRWKLKALSPTETEATYEIEVEVSLLVPGFIVNYLIAESLPQTLEEFRSRAEGLIGKKSKKKGTPKSRT